MLKRKNKILVGLTTLALSVALVGCQSDEGTKAPTENAYPGKTVKIVAPSGAGGGWDTTARLVSKVLGETGIVEASLPVENIEGGSGKVFLENFMKSKPDGNTIFVNSPPIILNAAQGFKYSYEDVTPIAQVINEYASFAVKNDSKYTSLEAIIEALKKDPSSVKIAGGSAPGGMDHLAFMLVAKEAGIDITKINYVPFQGGGEAMTTMLGGNVDVVSTGISETLGQLEAGTIRVLGVTSGERLGGVLADVPTAKELGYDATFEIWRGFFGAKDMPENAKKYWEEKLAEMTETTEWKAILEKQNWDSVYRDSEEFKTFLAEQTVLINELMTDLKLK